MKPVDPRAGKLCSNCNTPKPAPARRHCGSPTCNWWRCNKCDALNDAQGRNDQVSLGGKPKGGRAA